MAKIKPAKKKGTMPKSVFKKGGSTSMKAVKAPAGFHWMKDGSGFKLMKHSGKFVKHPGASLTAKFKIQKRHSK
tara:strand:- start:747 stop:968 length:222 start_codon:yes stop_codon:yes gene_type:complete